MHSASQVGYAWNNALLYVKGGGAVTSNNYRIFDIPSGLLTDTASDTRFGGVVGVGFEYAITPGWSVGFEYDHLFMGSRNVNFNSFGAFDGTERHQPECRHVHRSLQLQVRRAGGRALLISRLIGLRDVQKPRPRPGLFFEAPWLAGKGVPVGLRTIRRRPWGPPTDGPSQPLRWRAAGAASN